MTTRTLILLSWLVALCCSACGRSGADGPSGKVPRPLSSLESYRHCERDDQCVWVNNGCCDCANGGEDIAVAIEKKAAFRSQFQCDNTPCTMMSVEPPCGTGKVACEAGLCVFHPSDPRQL